MYPSIKKSKHSVLWKEGKKVFSFLFLLGYLLPLMMAQEPVDQKQKTLKKDGPYFYEEKMKKGVKLTDLDKRNVAVYNQGTAITVKSKKNTLAPGVTKEIKLLKNSTVMKYSSKENPKGADKFCTTVDRKVDVVSDESGMLKNPGDEFIWPGALVDGNSIASGAFSILNKGRTPINIYETRLKYENPDDGIKRNVEPTYLEVLSAIRGVLNSRLDGPQGAEGLVYWEEVKRNEDLSIAMNISCNSLFADFGAEFNFDENKATRTFLAGYVQTYYVFNADIPIDPKDFFDPTIPNIPDSWVYVSSVKYGRIGLLAINVTDYEKVSDINLKAEVDAFIFGNYNASTHIRELITENGISIRGFFYGGNPDDAGKVMMGSPDEVAKRFKDAWQNGMTYSEINPGLPIAYTLRYVNTPNHDIASVQQTLEYTQRECTEANIYRVTLMDIKCLSTTDQDEWNNPAEIYGNMAAYLFKFNQSYDKSKKNSVQGVKPYVTKDNFLWNADKGQRVSVKMGERLPDLSNKYLEFKVDASVGDRPRFYLIGDMWEADVDQLDKDDDDHMVDPRYSRTDTLIDFERISKEGVPYYATLRFFSGGSKFTASFKFEAMGIGIEPSTAIPKDVIRYKVTLENLKGLSNNDQGNRNDGEDIFGKMEAYIFQNAQIYDAKNAEIKGVQGMEPLYGDFNYLWWAKSSQRFENVKKGDVKPIGKTVVFDVNEKAIPNYYVYAIGDIWDYDSGNDDNDHFNTSSQLETRFPLSAVPKNGTPYRFKLYFGVKEERRLEANFKVEAFRGQDPSFR